MSKLQDIRDAFDAAYREWEKDHTEECAPEGLSSIDAARILYEQWAHDQLVLVEAASPKAA